MRRRKDGIRLSASDVAGHLACGHLTQLNLAVAEGKLTAPGARDPAAQVLAERGLRHEAAYLAHLRGLGKHVVELGNDRPPADTLAAMRDGADVIAQAHLADGRFVGFADVLFKVPGQSNVGAYAYEIHDTKLAREAKAGAVLQLCLYADLLQKMQGVLPEYAKVISPGRDFEPHTFRVHDFLAYYRWVRSRLEAALANPPATYPEPVEHCEVCIWRAACDARWRADDHLSLVAGIARAQRRELESRGIMTLARLAVLPLPLPFKPDHGSAASLTHVREQARLQLAGRVQQKPVHELLLPSVAGRGLARLPEPSPYDVFFDFEGDPFVEGGGLEYLWGWGTIEAGAFVYQSMWALDRAQERRAFVAFVDMLSAMRRAHPEMHVYHYAPYEPAALKRLSCRLNVGAEDLDALLRAEVFVDLYGVVRQGLRASVESYSIKRMEPFFGFGRDVALPDVGPAKRALETALELALPGEAPDVAPAWRIIVETYNRDDCRAAWGLRQWLEDVRAAAIAAGEPIERPLARESEVPAAEESVNTRLRRQRLMAMVPEDPHERTASHRALAVLADLLDFERREHRSAWWEYFRLRDLPAADLLDERRALAGLAFAERLPRAKRGVTWTDRYVFPPQDVDVRPKDKLETHGDAAPQVVGEVVKVDSAGWVDIKKTKAAAELHPVDVFARPTILNSEAPAALGELSDWVGEHGLDADQPEHRAARDLLSRRAPRLSPESRGFVAMPGETPLARACRVACDLDAGVLPIQGPPGAGKTFTAAHIITALVRGGKRVGVTAVSHQVIASLVDRTQTLFAEHGVRGTIGRKPGSAETWQHDSAIHRVGSAADAAEALGDGTLQVMGGTLFLWTCAAMRQSVDVLLIDEAGQLALANACAVSRAARSVILVGDPRQLEQPQKAAHPEGAEVSALQHMLGTAATVADDAGLFLAQTYRLAPAVCAFTSELFYASRLHADPSCANQRIDTPSVAGAGLWLVPVAHHGNTTSSLEEAAAAARLVAQLCGTGSRWTNPKNETLPLGPHDILVVAPYNAQVAALRRVLPQDVRVGTVDKFQGQEAAVVVVSMTSSSAQEAPRGMEFLYSAHRINVATSRARAACFLLANMDLFEPPCRTPEQMRLANIMCRYREMAASLTVVGPSC